MSLYYSLTKDTFLDEWVIPLIVTISNFYF